MKKNKKKNLQITISREVVMDNKYNKKFWNQQNYLVKYKQISTKPHRVNQIWVF